MSRSSLFPGGEDFSIEYCAICRAYMHIRYIVTIGKEKFTVCSLNCEKKLKAKHEVNKAANETT